MDYEGSNVKNKIMHWEKGFKVVVPQQARNWSAVSRPKATLGDFIIPTSNRFKAMEPSESLKYMIFYIIQLGIGCPHVQTRSTTSPACAAQSQRLKTRQIL